MATFLEIALWNAAAAAVLALAAAAVSRLFRRPALTHTLWVLVLLKLVTPPLVPFSLTLPGAEVRPAPPPEEPAALAPDDADPIPADAAWEGEEAPAVGLPEPGPVPAVAPPVDWSRWAGLAWLFGSVLWGAWVAWHVIRFRRVLRLARLAPGRLQEEAETLARRLGLRRCPDVWLVPGAVSPMVWGLGGRPCLLFPTGLLDRLDAGGRAALLAHELAHVRRRDHWVRLLELAATGLYWWHPALWWARRELHEAEEQCCDAWAVWALGGDARPYALALLQAVAFVSQARPPLPLGASGVGQVSHLKRRLAMVMQGKTSRSLSWAGLGVVLGLGLLLLPLFPALGQQPPARVPAADPDLPGAERDRGNRDKQIDDLKKILAVLEAQKAQEAAGQDTKDARAQALQAQLRELDRAMAAKKKELAELMVQADRVRTQLKELETRPDPRQRNRAPAGALPPKASDGRVEDLEKKLDRIQKELEELRRELRPDRTPRLRTGFPGGPATPEPPPAALPPARGAPAAPGTSLPSRVPPPPDTDDALPVPTPPAPPSLVPRGVAPPAPPTTPLPPADVAPPGATPPPPSTTPLPPSRAIPPAADTAPPPATTTPRS
jgi:beta-lactamase regulating signal transducer with metallopeptidase domain